MDKKSELDQAIDLIVSEDPRDDPLNDCYRVEKLSVNFWSSATPVWMFILGVVVLAALTILF